MENAYKAQCHRPWPRGNLRLFEARKNFKKLKIVSLFGIESENCRIHGVYRLWRMACSGVCASCPMHDICGTEQVPEQMMEALAAVRDSLQAIRVKILVLSGKGGVGKSTLVYLLAKELSKKFQVSILDLDLCGPSMPYMFHVESERLRQTALGFEPCFVDANLSLVSSQFFLQDETDAIIARGQIKSSLTLQFLKDVYWGETEVLIIDTPPGTSDEHLSIVSFMKESGIDGAVIVTTSDEVTIGDVRREITFCVRAGVRILGIVENMSSYFCPHCGEISKIYPSASGGVGRLCAETNLNFLGEIAIDPGLIACGDAANIRNDVWDAVSEICARIKEVL
jgi:Mrp family chromosome partitioning ATPase